MEIPATTGRGVLGRVIVLVAVIASLTLLAVPMCADGMTMAIPVAPSAAAVLPDGGGEVVSTYPHWPDPAGGDGVLAGCLALLLALAAGAAGLRRRQNRWARPPRLAVARWIRSVVGWPADLSQLCVLRT